MEPIAIVILAAGRGTRLGGGTAKALLESVEGPLIELCLETALSLRPERLVVVTGFKREEVEAVVSRVAPHAQFAFQSEQRGTADAVSVALPALKGFNGSVLILYADMPLVLASSIEKMRAIHESEKATLSLITVHTTSFPDYGRVMRDDNGKVNRIVEARDCSPIQYATLERNPAFYLIDSAFLEPAVAAIKPQNAQNEFYLTDLIEIASREGQNISSLPASDLSECQGVNTWKDLALVNSYLQQRRVFQLLESGVRIVDTSSVFISRKAHIGSGVTIGPFVQILGNARIGDGAHLEGSNCVQNAEIKPGEVLAWGSRRG